MATRRQDGPTLTYDPLEVADYLLRRMRGFRALTTPYGHTSSPGTARRLEATLRALTDGERVQVRGWLVDLPDHPVVWLEPDGTITLCTREALAWT